MVSLVPLDPPKDRKEPPDQATVPKRSLRFWVGRQAAGPKSAPMSGLPPYLNSQGSSDPESRWPLQLSVASPSHTSP